MTTIKSSAELRNSYNKISSLCHEHSDPVFITKNGQGDLAVMSIEAYDLMQARLDLYAKLLQGLNDVNAGKAKSAEEVLSDLQAMVS